MNKDIAKPPPLRFFKITPPAKGRRRKLHKRRPGKMSRDAVPIYNGIVGVMHVLRPALFDDSPMRAAICAYDLALQQVLSIVVTIRIASPSNRLTGTIGLLGEELALLDALHDKISSVTYNFDILGEALVYENGWPMTVRLLQGLLARLSGCLTDRKLYGFSPRKCILRELPWYARSGGRHGLPSEVTEQLARALESVASAAAELHAQVRAADTAAKAAVQKVEAYCHRWSLDIKVPSIPRGRAAEGATA